MPTENPHRHGDNMQTSGKTTVGRHLATGMFLCIFDLCSDDTLTLLVRVRITGHNGADGGERNAGHGSNGSSCPHHPTVTKHNTKILLA